MSHDLRDTQAPLFYLVETASQGIGGRDDWIEWERYDALWLAQNRARVIHANGVRTRISRCQPLPNVLVTGGDNRSHEQE